MTPPRDGDRTGDDQLVARVIPLRRRDTNGVALADAPAPTPEYTLFDEPGEPTPMLNRHDMWGEPAYQLRQAGAGRRSRRRGRPDAAAAAAAARSAAGAGGRVRPRGARGRRGDHRLARGAPRPPARRSRARTANQHHGGARTSREPCCRTAALIEDYLARRRPGAAGSRARRAPRACAGARPRTRLVAPRERGADHAGRRGSAELERSGGAGGRVELARRERCDQPASRCARAVGYRSEQVRAGRPHVLSYQRRR